MGTNVRRSRGSQVWFEALMQSSIHGFTEIHHTPHYPTEQKPLPRREFSCTLQLDRCLRSVGLQQEPVGYLAAPGLPRPGFRWEFVRERISVGIKKSQRARGNAGFLLHFSEH